MRGDQARCQTELADLIWPWVNHLTAFLESYSSILSVDIPAWLFEFQEIYPDRVAGMAETNASH